MEGKEEIEKLEKQISKKKKELQKAQDFLIKYEEKAETLTQELESLETKYIKETLKLNNMTFDEFKNLLEIKN